VRRVALDEGSRTSAALTRILLAEMYGIQPNWEPLPIGCGVETTDADAVLLIGDRPLQTLRPMTILSKFGISARSGAIGPGCHLCLQCGLPGGRRCR